MKPQHQRWKIFIDRPIQGTLLLRAVTYWAVCLMMQQLVVFLFVLLTSASDSIAVNGTHVLWHIQVSIVASLAILPLIVLDILKLSHRWVGPVFRLRATLHSLTLGEPVPPIRFREGDFWQDLARDVNAVTAELNHHRANQPKADVATESFPSTNDHEVGCGSHQESIPVTSDSVHRFKAYSDEVVAPLSVPISPRGVLAGGLKTQLEFSGVDSR